MHIIKAVPEDFAVTEVGSPHPSGSGPYAYFVLQKRGWNTLDALEAIAAKTNASIKDFGWAGNKDKQAVTRQVCSVKGMGRERLENATLPGCTITYLGQAGRPVALGSHEGNRFTIVVRNLERLPQPAETFVNLFGDQRFSTHNVAIGRALIKKQYDLVVEHLLHDPRRAQQLQDALAKHPKDTLGALQHLPHNLLMLFIHAYQSSLWNVAARHLADGQHPQVKLPLLGFGTTTQQLDEFPILREQLKAEAITTRDFVLRSLPSLSSEGGDRDLYATATEMVCGPYLDDEMNPGKNKFTVSFTLQKGSYATEFIRQNIG